jgi:hypothetical protein
MWAEFAEHPCWKQLAEGMEKERQGLIAKVMDPTSTDAVKAASLRGQYNALGATLNTVRQRAEKEIAEGQGATDVPASPIPIRARAETPYMRSARPARPGS